MPPRNQQPLVVLLLLILMQAARVLPQQQDPCISEKKIIIIISGTLLCSVDQAKYTCVPHLSADDCSWPKIYYIYISDSYCIPQCPHPACFYFISNLPLTDDIKPMLRAELLTSNRCNLTIISILLCSCECLASNSVCVFLFLSLACFRGVRTALEYPVGLCAAIHPMLTIPLEQQPVGVCVFIRVLVILRVIGQSLPSWTEHSHLLKSCAAHSSQILSFYQSL